MSSENILQTDQFLELIYGIEESKIRTLSFDFVSDIELSREIGSLSFLVMFNSRRCYRIG
jgi:hypothetical protein